MKTANLFKNKLPKNTAGKAFHSACQCMQSKKLSLKNTILIFIFVENAFIVKQADKKNQ